MARVERLSAVRKRFQELGIDALLVMGNENRRYLSGFTGSEGGVVIGRDRAFIVVDFRYLEQAAAESPGFEVVRWKNHPDEALGQAVGQALGPGLHRLGFEKDILTVAWHEQIKAVAGDAELVPVQGVVEALRARKDQEELAAVKRAAGLVLSVWQKVPRLVRAGRTEAEAALDLEVELRRAGSEAIPFEPILASGPLAALPHTHAGSRRLARGDVVILDLGATCSGYCSDFTRTLVVGPPTPRQRELHDIVVRARDAAVAAVRPGVKGCDVDKAGRDVIAAAGYGEAFGHGLGHGVGLVVHEEPRCGMESQTVLAPGMVTTIEPGIYIPGWGGVRVEDMVLVTPGGCEVLTPMSLDLVVV